MNNVFPLFQQIAIESPADPRTQVTTAVTVIMASNAQLERRIKDLSMHLDVIDHVIEVLGEVGRQEGLRQLSKIIREALMHASRELSEHVKILPTLRNDFVAELSDELKLASRKSNLTVSR